MVGPDPVGFGIADILIVVLPASIVGLLAASFVQMRRGKGSRTIPSTRNVSPKVRFNRSTNRCWRVVNYLPGKRSTMIFLAGIAVIVILGMFEQLRPAFS